MVSQGEERLKELIKLDFGLTDTEIKSHLDKAGGNRNVALSELRERLLAQTQRDAVSNLVKSLDHAIRHGRRMRTKGAVLLEAIAVTGEGEVDITEGNIKKLLLLSAHSERMIKSGMEMETKALERLIELTKKGNRG